MSTIKGKSLKKYVIIFLLIFSWRCSMAKTFSATEHKIIEKLEACKSFNYNDLETLSATGRIESDFNLKFDNRIKKR